MGAGHAHKLYRHCHSPVHALPPHCKLAAALTFVIVVVSTPREAVWSFALYAVLLAGVAGVARMPAAFLLKRLLIEVPFVAFAVLMPFVVPGEQVHVLGLSLARRACGTPGTSSPRAPSASPPPSPGLHHRTARPAARSAAAEAATAARPDRLLHDPLRRRHHRRDAPHVRSPAAPAGFEARGVRHWGVLGEVGRGAFIRSYERGERVHLAMVSRGYTGTYRSSTK